VPATVPTMPQSLDTDGPWSSFEPIGKAADPQGIGRPPSATVDPDRTLSWWRRLLPLLKPTAPRVAIALFAALVAQIVGVEIPQVLKRAIDRGLIARSEPLSKALIILGVLAVVRALLTYYYRASLYQRAYELEEDLRTTMYGHLTRMSFSFYDRVQAGQLISRANSDIRSVQLYLTFAPLIAISFVSFFVAVVAMLRIHAGLTLVAIAVLPLVFFVSVRLRNLLFPLSWLVQARAADIATIVDENVNGVRVVKGFAAEQRQLGALARAAQRMRWASIEQVDARARYGPLVENLPRLGLAAVLLYGGKLAIDQAITIGDLVAFNAYVVLLQAPFRVLGFLLVLQQRAAASAARIFEVLDEKPTITDRPGAIDLVDPRGDIEFRDVDFAYPGKEPVLEGLSFHVSPGETVAIVGRTGSGKSTIARLLTRFYDVDNGAVLVDGHDVRDLTMTSLRHHVGVVLDEPFLFSESAAANIAYARPNAAFSDIEAAARAAQAEDFILALHDGYDTVIGERGYDLSGGQRQRVAIARALLANPRILVLDDATSAIDVRVEEAIHGALDDLLADRTSIVIAHRLSTIALADRVLLLEDGRIVASGTHQQLLVGVPLYREVLASLQAVEAPDTREVD
jgi:ATP-binding cassette subfamily B protein